MDKHAQLWNQYQHLTDEIKAADSQNFQILGVVIAAVVAILNAGLANSDPATRFWMLLSGYILTYPARRLFAGNQARIWRIATYMRVFMEPEFEHVRWQTRLYNRSQLVPARDRGTLSSRIVGYELGIFATLNAVVAVALAAGALMSASAALAAWVRGWSGVALPPAALFAAGFAAIAASAVRYLVTTARLRREIERHGVVETAHLAAWSAVKDSELAASA